MALVYTVETSSKFALFYDDPNSQGADPNELLEKVKKENELQRLEKEKAKKAEREKSKKVKSNVPVEPVTQAPVLSAAQEPKEPFKVSGDPSQLKKPQHQLKPRTADEQQKSKFPSRPQAQTAERQTLAEIDKPSDLNQNAGDRVIRPNRGFRGSRGRGYFRRNDLPLEGQDFATTQPNLGDTYESRPFSGYRGRGGRGRGIHNNSGSHPFDRISGSRYTGVKPFEKRNGAGPHNWGNNIEAELNVNQGEALGPSDVLQNDSVHTSEVVSGNENAVLDVAIDKEENDPGDLQKESRDKEPLEPQEITVAEYLAKSDGERQRLQNMQQVLQKKNRKKINMSEKADDFAGMVPYVKNNEHEEDNDVEDENDPTDEQKRKLKLDIQFMPYRGGGTGRPYRPSRGTGYSGNRGSNFRGGRGRGGPSEYRGRGGRGFSGPRHDGLSLRLDSDVDFPSL